MCGALLHPGQTMPLLKDEELGTAVNEKAVIRKLNKHILLKFFLMCILCYIGTPQHMTHCLGISSVF